MKNYHFCTHATYKLFNQGKLCSVCMCPDVCTDRSVSHSSCLHLLLFHLALLSVSSVWSGPPLSASSSSPAASTDSPVKQHSKRIQHGGRNRGSFLSGGRVAEPHIWLWVSMSADDHINTKHSPRFMNPLPGEVTVKDKLSLDVRAS